MGPTRIHRKSWDNDWDVHFLTFSTFRRQPLFPGDHSSEWFLQSLAIARKRCPFHLFAYVIMPEHVHLVLQPLPGVEMRTVLWQIKRPMTARALTWVRQHNPTFLHRMADVQPTGKVTYRFWQRGGGYDRNLRSGPNVHDKIGYIHNNPVRRGLVERAEDWRHSSAADWILQKPGPVPIDWGYLPTAGRYLRRRNGHGFVPLLGSSVCLPPKFPTTWSITAQKPRQMRWEASRNMMTTTAKNAQLHIASHSHHGSGYHFPLRASPMASTNTLTMDRFATSRRRHRSLGRQTPASVYGLDVMPQEVNSVIALPPAAGSIETGDGRSAAMIAAVAPVAPRAPSATAADALAIATVPFYSTPGIVQRMGTS